MRKLVYGGLMATGLAGIVGCGKTKEEMERDKIFKDRIEEAKKVFPVVGYYLFAHNSSIGITTADMNGDGRPDIIVTTADYVIVDSVSNRSKEFGKGAVYVFLNNGDGTYTPQVHPVKAEKNEAEKR